MAGVIEDEESLPYLADFLDDLEVSIRELSVDGKCCSYYSTRVGLCN